MTSFINLMMRSVLLMGCVAAASAFTGPAALGGVTRSARKGAMSSKTPPRPRFEPEILDLLRGSRGLCGEESGDLDAWTKHDRESFGGGSQLLDHRWKSTW